MATRVPKNLFIPAIDNDPRPLVRPAPRAQQRPQKFDQHDRPKRIFLQRDSQAYRERTGNPGSRRYRRFLNLAYLNAVDTYDDDLWDKRHREEYDTESDISRQVEWRSIFQDLFSSENMAIWEPFCNVTEEKQEKLLRLLAPSDQHHTRSMTPAAFCDAHTKFVGLSVDTRQMLKQAVTFDLVQMLERVLFAQFSSHPRHKAEEGLGDSHFVVLGPSSLSPGVHGRHKLGPKSLIILFKNAKDRKICHGVCKYYSLPSWSEDTKWARE